MKNKIGTVIGVCIGIVIMFNVLGNDEATTAVGEEGSPVEVITNPYLMWSYQYANRNGIELEEVKGADDLTTWIEDGEAENSQELYVTLDVSIFNLLSDKPYKITAEKSSTFYRGETKDNYPHGYGVLYTKSGDIQTIIYIGEFNKGYFDGYGMLFAEPSGNDETVLWNIFQGNIDSDEYMEYYYAFVNYVSFEGEFEDGEANGDGNMFAIGLYYSLLAQSNEGIEGFDPSSINISMTIGEFRDGEPDGDIKKYVGGLLYYDGEMEDGDRDGKGTQYYMGSGSLLYEGTFKNDDYHGSGTLYDESGGVVYSGDWSNGDYA